MGGQGEARAEQEPPTARQRHGRRRRRSREEQSSAQRSSKRGRRQAKERTGNPARQTQRKDQAQPKATRKSSIIRASHRATQRQEGNANDAHQAAAQGLRTGPQPQTGGAKAHPTSPREAAAASPRGAKPPAPSNPSTKPPQQTPETDYLPVALRISSALPSCNKELTCCPSTPVTGAGFSPSSEACVSAQAAPNCRMN